MVRRDDPFWISADRFLGCYSGQSHFQDVSLVLQLDGNADADRAPCVVAVEHWQIPNLSTLTNIARRTLKQLNPHLPMVRFQFIPDQIFELTPR